MEVGVNRMMVVVGDVAVTEEMEEMEVVEEEVVEAHPLG